MTDRELLIALRARVTWWRWEFACNGRTVVNFSRSTTPPLRLPVAACRRIDP